MQAIVRTLTSRQPDEQHSRLYRLRWRLFILFFPLAGPFLAPLFTYIGIWPFGMIAQFVYFLGEIFCPLPDRAVLIAGYSTAVCPLCYGALLGLTSILLSFPFRPTIRHLWENIAWPLRLLLITAALVPWLSDYVLNKVAWTFTPLWAMYLLGIPAGLAVGLLAYFVMGKPGERQSF
ncbi:MAG: hypothetical protein NVS4B7_13830 [Ktedonobacteraceae bacterium]